jgi:phage shock protein A
LSQFFNNIIKNIFNPAEEPHGDSDLSGIEQQLQLLHDLDRALDEVNLAKNQLIQLSQRLRSQAVVVLSKAKQALVSDREDLARISLNRRQIMIREAKKIKHQIIEIEQEAERLTIIQQNVTTGLEAYSTKRDVLSARQTAAEAQVAVGEVIGGITEGSIDLNKTLEFAEKNREDIQMRVEAINDLIRNGDEFANLDDQNNVAIEQELEYLKRYNKSRDNE